MASLSAKEEMQTLIRQSASEAPATAYEALLIYQKTFGEDLFVTETLPVLYPYGPLVALICLNCPDAVVDDFLARQNYHNVEIARTTTEDSYADIIDYIRQTPAKYFCFLEEGQFYDENKIAKMVWCLESKPQPNIALTTRAHIDENGTIISHPDYAYIDSLYDHSFHGRLLLDTSLADAVNIYGRLSSMLVSSAYAADIAWQTPMHTLDPLNRVDLLYQILLGGTCHYIKETLVYTFLAPYREEQELCDAYAEFASAFAAQNSLSSYGANRKFASETNIDKKEITFFYIDKGEYYNLKPLADEAARRGYDVIFTEKLTQKAEIGVYCQHVCFPENAKFSLVLLHDLAQGHNRWPDIWNIEHWQNFDFAVVPGSEWSARWRECSFNYYTNPRLGVYELGYPKSDLIHAPSLKQRAQELKSKMNLKHDFSILYAPSWENDGKEDDFVQALTSLPVNLLIKQAHFSDAYPEIIKNIATQRALHENKYENVHYIEPEESIMTALELCDMVVSDESSVMYEALMFGKPSLAVTDWLVPDTTPSRLAVVPVDCVYKCTRDTLRTTAEKIMQNIHELPSRFKGETLFANAGNCCRQIMDAIEYYTAPDKKTDCTFLEKKLSPKYTTCSMWN